MTILTKFLLKIKRKARIAAGLVSQASAFCRLIR
jgi:hypothetical protein